MSDETKKNRNNQPLEADSVVAEPKREQQPCLPLASLEIVQRYWSELMHGRVKKICGLDRPSTAEIMQIARLKLHQYTHSNNVFDSLGEHSSLSNDITGDVNLALLLQASAEMFANKQFDGARNLLGICNQSASADGSTVERIVYYFGNALKERINRDSDTSEFPVDLEEALMSLEGAIIGCEQQLPFSQVTKFTGVHAILDNITSAATKIHFIDFQIRIGSHWTIIMQDLANKHNPIQLLKITAVGASKQRIERTGKWLSSFAETMNLPFSFRAIVSNMKDLRRDVFELEEDEIVAVYTEYRISTLLVCPNQLQNLIRVIQSLNPSVMVVVEAEANTNTPNFLARFYNLLSYCAATFDSLATCMEPDHEYRKIAEQVFHRELIRNIITMEGEKRIHRHAKIDFWREIFSRFGIEEQKLSDSALDQASFLIQRYGSWSGCSLDMDGKSMIIKWKGTPVKSLSVWKFCPLKNT